VPTQHSKDLPRSGSSHSGTRPGRVSGSESAAMAAPCVATGAVTRTATEVGRRTRLPRARGAKTSGRSARSRVIITFAGAGEERDKYNSQAKEDDARQYGVWGVDGIRQRSASFAKMEEDWEQTVRASPKRPSQSKHDRDRDVVDIRRLGGANAQVAKRSDRFWKREWFHDPARDGTRMGYHADGIRQKSASFAAMTADWEDAVRRRRSLENSQTDGKKPKPNSPRRPNLNPIKPNLSRPVPPRPIAQVSQVWISAGATEVATQRLLILGAKWQKGALGEIYRDPEAVSVMVRSLESLLPGANPAAVFHGCPEAALVCVDRNALSAQLVALRTGVGISRFDLARVVTHSPSLLLMRDAQAQCAESAAALRATFLGTLLGDEGVAAAIEVCPALLEAPAEDVAGAFEGFGDDVGENVADVGGASFRLALDRHSCAGPSGARGGVIGEMTDGDKKEAARETGMRHAVDYAGRVAEPYLRRAKVAREKARPR